LKISVREMASVSLFTALTAMGAFISIPVGPVPITLQTLFVLLSGILLGPKLGAISQLIYVILGLIGIPIFAEFSGGLQSVLKPSFGFLIGFIPAAYIVGRIIKNSRFTVHNSQLKEIVLAGSIGTIAIYLIGLPYMYFILNHVMNMQLSFFEVFKMGAFLFIPGDIFKLIISTVIGQKLTKYNLFRLIQ